MLNEEMMKKAREAGSPEELLKLAEQSGIPLEKDLAEKYFNSLHASGEIKDDELESAAGGCGSYEAAVKKTCPLCGGSVLMKDYINVNVIEPRSSSRTGYANYHRDYSTGVCSNCGRRFAYVPQVARCFLITDEGEPTIRPEYSLPAG